MGNRSKLSWLIPVGLAAGLAYFLSSPGRRNRTRDQIGAFFRRMVRQGGQQARYLGGELHGVIQETIPHQRDNSNPDDRTLKERVQTEIFRNPETSRENLNVNVVDGIVELRGELPHPEDIDKLIDQVKGIADVREVHSYLHLPNTPAPNKVSAIRAS